MYEEKSKIDPQTRLVGITTPRISFNAEIFLASLQNFLMIVSFSPTTLHLDKVQTFHSYSKMMSFRSFSRAIPRSIPRIAAQRHPRTFSSIPLTSILRQDRKAASIPRYAALSTSRALRQKEGQGVQLRRRAQPAGADYSRSGPRTLSEDRVRASDRTGNKRFRKASLIHLGLSR